MTAQLVIYGPVFVTQEQRNKIRTNATSALWNLGFDIGRVLFIDGPVQDETLPPLRGHLTGELSELGLSEVGSVVGEIFKHQLGFAIYNERNETVYSRNAVIPGINPAPLENGRASA